jgi:hypothetical protein
VEGRVELETVCLTEEDILVHNRLLREPAEVAGFGRVGRGYLFLYACPGEVDVKEEQKDAKSDDRRLETSATQLQLELVETYIELIICSH